MASHSLPTGALVVRTGRTGDAFYEAKWRWEGSQVKRRIGPAWLDPEGARGWTRRRGRVPKGHFDEKRATVRMAELIAAHAERSRRDQVNRQQAVTFRKVAADWLSWLEQVKGARPSTLRNYRRLLADPGAPRARGSGKSKGRIIAAFGDHAAATITTGEVSSFLRRLDGDGVSPRSVNQARQILSAIFNYGRREDTFGLPRNPVVGTDKRREPPAAALDFFEPEEVEQLATAAAGGAHRDSYALELGDTELAARCHEDVQDADLFRVLAYTGLRVGEALALHWGDVDIPGRRLIVQRARSAGVEGPTKSWQVPYVPLANPAVEALVRLRARLEFTSRDDLVFCGRLGEPLDDSALRRRYHAARRAAGLRHIKLHGLRHGAGSLIAREMDPVFIQQFLGHSKLSTTERCMHAKARHDDVDRLNRAFGTDVGRFSLT